MRPIRLEVKNFTAYRDVQVLDFTDLDLFAITGPTGSGKSSLLDAMTYALYGRAPRVGARAALLIAQGQPAMSVRFDFDVDGRRYRVVRTAGHRPSDTKIRLEEERGGEWESYGDGADRIKDATALIEGLVGLDYVAFTRSVLLPQGEFQEFLAGDPKDRRDILTELLGLELFERVARRAGEAARAARAAAQAKEEVLARRYAGVDQASLKQARKRAKETKARHEAMAEMERALDGLAREWDGLERRIEGLDELEEEAREMAGAAGEACTDLERTVEALTEASAAVTDAEAAAEAADGVLAEVSRNLATAEELWGTSESLVALGAGLERLGALGSRIDGAQDALAGSRQRAVAAEAALARARDAAARSAANLEEVIGALAEAEAEHERAHRADMVGTLVRGKRVGEPCPVCRRPLEEVPRTDSRQLARVRKVLDRAKAAVARADTERNGADRDVSLGERDVQTVNGDVERHQREVLALEGERVELASALEGAFGGPLPPDPEGSVRDRMEGLRLRRQALEACRAAAVRASEEVAAARRRCADLTAQAAEAVGVLRGLPIPGLVRRVRQWLPDPASPAALVGAIPPDPADALEAGRGLAAGANELATTLVRARDGARASMVAVLNQARAHLPPGLPATVLQDIDDLVQAARTSSKELLEEATEARAEVGRLTAMVKERAELEKEVRAASAEAAVYHDLSQELRADRLITFLQGEALELLAAAGSEGLLFLSQGRYRLAFRGDEFFVEDRQNGDDQRSVRTLSGGETFLASLALALALSEQIQSLAVTPRARLESLFIDEGFGNLDPETLEVAAEALSQLGGQDRMVGVITHVSELAERLPVRIEISKLPGGSRLELVP